MEPNPPQLLRQFFELNKGHSMKHHSLGKKKQCMKKFISEIISFYVSIEDG